MSNQHLVQTLLQTDRQTTKQIALAAQTLLGIMRGMTAVGMENNPVALTPRESTMHSNPASKSNPPLDNKDNRNGPCLSNEILLSSGTKAFSSYVYNQNSDSQIENALTAFANLQYALSQDIELSLALEHLERAIILAAILRHTRQKDVYSGLRISRTTLDAKSKKYGIGKNRNGQNISY